MAIDYGQEIITSVVAALKVRRSVHAVWLEGSLASGFMDAYSDIDLWIDADADAVEEVFGEIREALLTLGPLALEQAVTHPDPQIVQRFFRLADISPFLFLDVCVQHHGRGTLLPSHEPFRVLHDPGGIVRVAAASPDTASLVASRLEILRASWWRRVLVLKEVERGHRLEALGYYRSMVLEPLTERLRLRYCPEKHDYGLKHIQRDLPAEVVVMLEALYAVTDLCDLPAAVAQADALFASLDADR